MKPDDIIKLITEWENLHEKAVLLDDKYREGDPTEVDKARKAYYKYRSSVIKILKRELRQYNKDVAAPHQLKYTRVSANAWKR